MPQFIRVTGSALGHYEIFSVVVYGDPSNNESKFIFTEPSSTAINSITKIEIMERCRLGSDKVNYSYKPSGNLTCQLSYVSLPNPPPIEPNPAWVELTSFGSKYWQDFDVSDDFNFFACTDYGEHPTLPTGVAGFIYTTYMSGGVQYLQRGTIWRVWHKVRSSYIIGDNGVIYTPTMGTGRITGVLPEGLTVAENTGAAYLVLYDSFHSIHREYTGYDTMTNANIPANKLSVGVSYDDTRMIIVADSGGVYYATSISTFATSNDHGAGSDSWTVNSDFNFTLSSDNVPNAFLIECSATAQYSVIATTSGYLYLTIDYGVTWSALINSGNRSWIGCRISADGHIIIGFTSSKIYRSYDYGTTFRDVTPIGLTTLHNCGLSPDGLKMVTGQYIGNLFKVEFSQ